MFIGQVKYCRAASLFFEYMIIQAYQKIHSYLHIQSANKEFVLKLNLKLCLITKPNIQLVYVIVLEIISSRKKGILALGKCSIVAIHLRQDICPKYQNRGPQWPSG